MAKENPMTLARFSRYVAAGVLALALLAGPAATTASAAIGSDLSAGSIDGSQYLKPGEKVHFDTCVENQGDQATGVFNIAWYVSGQRVGYGSHSGVPAHTKICGGNSQFDWTAPNDVGGSRVIKWVVDEDNMVQDSDRGNNSSEITVVIHD
jgi:subtilase family serine protease